VMSATVVMRTAYSREPDGINVAFPIVERAVAPGGKWPSLFALRDVNAHVR
jgi:hypothetical protein